MDRISFYNKRKTGNFTLAEMKKLISFLNLESIEDKVLTELGIEAKKTELMSEEESNQLIDNLINGTENTKAV